MLKLDRKFLHQAAVFLITGFAYGAASSFRSTWAYSKHSLELDPTFTITKPQIGTIDLLFLCSYSTTLLFFGGLGDKLHLKVFISIGMIGAACCYLMIALMKINGWYSVFGVYVCILLGGGFAGLIKPGIMSTIGNWLEKRYVGRAMGVWGALPNVGTIIGYQFGTIAVDKTTLGWPFAMIFVVCFMMLMLSLILFCIKAYPHEANIYLDADDKAQALLKNVDDVVADEKPIGYFEAMKLPGFPLYVIANCCLKSVYLAMVFWLSEYLQTLGLKSHASGISQLNMIGNFTGGIILGFLNDKFNKKAFFMPFFIFGSAICFTLVKYVCTKEVVVSFYITLFIAGVFLGGPINIVSSAIITNLSKGIKSKNSKRALSTVSGIMEGCSSFFSAGFMKLIPYFEERMFFVFTLMLFFAALSLLPLFIDEVKDIINARRAKNKNNDGYIQIEIPLTL